MALWRLVSDSVWQVIEKQLQQKAQEKLAKAAPRPSQNLGNLEKARADQLQPCPPLSQRHPRKTHLLRNPAPSPFNP